MHVNSDIWLASLLSNISKYIASVEAIIFAKLTSLKENCSIFFLMLRHKLNNFFWQLRNFFLTLRHKEEIRPSSKTTKNSDLSAYEIGIILKKRDCFSDERIINHLFGHSLIQYEKYWACKKRYWTRLLHIGFDFVQ